MASPTSAARDLQEKVQSDETARFPIIEFPEQPTAAQPPNEGPPQETPQDADVEQQGSQLAETAEDPKKQRKTKKKPSASKKRKRRAMLHKVERFAIQVGFFILAPGLFSAAFNGVKYVFTQMGVASSIELTAFVVLLLSILGFTVVFGRFFCGYACAFGTAGDILYDAVEFIRSKTPIPRLKVPTMLTRVLSAGKFIVLGAICAACILGIWGQYSKYSPWVSFSGLLFGSSSELNKWGLVLLGAIAFGAIIKKRFFCQFLCPLGALFSLMPTLGISSFTRRQEHCAASCGKCKQACPVDIWPDDGCAVHGECISCGNCADVCPMGNINFLALEKPKARAERLAMERNAEQDGTNEGASAIVEASAATEAKAAAEIERPDGKGAKRQKKDEKVARATSEDQGSSKTKRLGLASNTLRKTREKWILLRGTGTFVVLFKAIALFAVCWYLEITRYIPSMADVTEMLRALVVG